MKKYQKNEFIRLKMICLSVILSLITQTSFGENSNPKDSNSAQPREVSGTVSEETGDALLGATVVVKGTTIGTVTDMNGRFSLSVPPGSEALVFSYVGMTSQEVMIGDQRVFNVVMAAEALGIDEVVVVGYGVQKKESVVGAISTTTRETLEKRGGVSNLSAALSGQLPGVTVMQRSGAPGRDEPVIYIRGLSTWNEGQPLLLVDGIERPINDIDINEVESVSVLKDASATAVFGVKGANGVILITTRRGVVGKTRFSASASNAVKSISRMPRVMNSYDSFNYYNLLLENGLPNNENNWANITPYEFVKYYKQPQEEKYKYIFPDTDWVSELTKDFAMDQRVNLNITGGTDFVKYFGSLGYSHEDDIMYAPYNERGYQPGYAYNRLNYRGNLDFRLTESTDLQVNLSGFTGMRKESNMFLTSQLTSIFSQMEPMSMPVKHADGYYAKDPNSIQAPNPAAQFWETGVKYVNRTQLVSDLRLTQKLDIITKGLSVSGRLSYDTYMITNGPNISDGGNAADVIFEVIDPLIIYAQNAEDSSQYRYFVNTQGGSGRFNSFDFQADPIGYGSESVVGDKLERALFYQVSLNYNRTFTKNDISLLALMNRRENAEGAAFPNYREDWVGRATYNFDRRYFIEVNAAYNGSEKFSSEYRFGFFPSLALGWMVSNEKFLNYEWLNEFKIRGSIGQVGNDVGFGRWAYLDAWGYSGAANQKPDFGMPVAVTSPYNRYFEEVIANPDLRWETALKQNIGFDLGLMSNQFRMSFDYFMETRTDIFLSANQRTIPVTFGSNPVPANLGATETSGFELEITYRKRWESGWSIWLGESLTRARDLITGYEDAELLPAYQKQTGHMIRQIYSQVREGKILENWDEVFASTSYDSNDGKRPGSYTILDYNTDGLINNFDNIPFGFANNRPQNTYMTTLGFGYKNFNFMMQFYGVTNIHNSIFHKQPYASQRSASDFFKDNYWTPENPDKGFYPEPGGGNVGDLYIFDGSYLRLKTLEVSYNLPKKMTNYLGISNTRIYMNGNNLFLWSDLPYDIESGNIVALDTNQHPMYKQLNFGINIDF